VATGVEGHGGDEGDRRRDATDALDGGLDLVEVRHRLDPDEVDAAGDQRRGLLAEDVDRDVVVERAERLDDLARWADVAGDQRATTRGVDLGAGENRGGAVELVDAFAQAVEAEAQPVAAERVRHDDPRAGQEVAALDPPDDVRLGQVPDLGRVAELEAVGEQHRAHRTVGQDRAGLVEEVAEALAGLAALDSTTGRSIGERVVVDGFEGRGGGALRGGVRGRACPARAMSATPEAAAWAIHRSMIAGGAIESASATRPRPSPPLVSCQIVTL
jgi:hypothetical protein